MKPKDQIMHHGGLTLGLRGEVVPARVFDFAIFAPPQPKRCPYCATAILATSAVRCPSCGAPR